MLDPHCLIPSLKTMHLKPNTQLSHHSQSPMWCNMGLTFCVGAMPPSSMSFLVVPFGSTSQSINESKIGTDSTFWREI